MSLCLICSWKRWCHSVLLPTLICLGLTASAVAEGAVIRLGPNFEDVVYFPMLAHESVGELLDRANLGVEAYVRGIDSCQELLAIPKGTEPAYDKGQRTYAIITRIKTECWALVQLDPDAKVAPMEDTNTLDEEEVWGIRAFFGTLPGQLSFPAEVLTDENGATVGCNRQDLCALSVPDESEWADYNLYFQLLLVDGDRKYIAITEAYEGRSGFVFGVIWSDSADRVLEMFPRLN